MNRALFCLAACLLLGSPTAFAQKSAQLNFVVVKDDNGKPVRNASVILHPLEKDGKQGKGGFQLKTDPDGKASFPGAPYGKLRVQVLARGFQTFGEDYDIDDPVEDITIKLKRPQGQYSIYDDKHKPEEKPKQ